MTLTLRMQEAQVPLDAIGIPILVFTILMIITGIYVYACLKRKQVGRFLSLLRIVFISNTIWQILSVIYFMISPDTVPYLLSGSLDLVCSLLYALCVIFLNVSILEAFQVLTNLRPFVLTIFRSLAVILLLLTVAVFLASTVFGLPQLQPYFRLPMLAYAFYVILFNNLKTIYLLRLLYLDKLKCTRNNSKSRSTTVAKYAKINSFFITIFALDLIVMCLWAYGHTAPHSLSVKIGDTLAGVELLFYPRLICAFRDLRFDRRELKTVVKPHASSEPARSIKGAAQSVSTQG